MKMNMMQQADQYSVKMIERQNNHTLKSKRVGLEILSGNVDRMDFSDYLGQSGLAPEARTNKTTHEIMEHRLGLGLTGPKGK